MTNETLELTVTRLIPATRRKVFEAWLDAKMMSRFMQVPAEDAQPSKVTVDPRKDGAFEIIMRAGDRDIPHHGTYLDITPHDRLAFTWQSPFSLDDSVVTLTFREAGVDKTELTLHQVRFRSEEARLGHIKGWEALLDGLEKLFG